MRRNWFLDLDGVMADFDGHFFRRFGKQCQLLEDDETWADIDTYRNFFLELPLIEGCLNTLEIIEDNDITPIILTACPKHDYDSVARQKKLWVKENLGNYLVLPVLGGINKKNFVQNNCDILIDDSRKNIEGWEDEGGFGILHMNHDLTRAIIESIVKPVEVK